MGKEYSPADHELAYRTYRETHVWSRVMEAIGCSYPTVFNWARSEYRCPHECPWHGWDQLEAQETAALTAKATLVEQGNYDPYAHEVAMREAMKSLPKDKKAIVTEFVRSDVERMSHWEILYGIAYYKATGIPLDFAQIKDPLNQKEIKLTDLYANAKDVKDLEGGVRVLINIQNQIDALRIRMGLIKPDGVLPTPSEQAAEEEKAAKSVTLDDLREWRDRLGNTSGEQLNMLKELIQREDADLRVIEASQTEEVQ